ncbi:MAG TPA: DUF2975 domain-containing protein [Puia sp.]|nr:DUF2975 domain-containing protein [Puia sp.]
MNVKLNTNRIVNVVIIGFIILTLAQWAYLYFLPNFSISGEISNSTNPNKNYIWENNLQPIDSVISDSISHRNYIKLTDSIKTIRQLKNGNYMVSGGVQTLNLLGTDGGDLCDTCSSRMVHELGFFNDRTYTQYYIKLFGWKINESKLGFTGRDSVLFHVVHGQSFIRKEVRFPQKHKIEPVDIPVKFRYDQRDQCLLIPVSTTTKRIIDILIAIPGVILGFYMLFLIACFLKFILDLSKGLSFTDENVARLKLIAVSLLIYPVVIFLLNLLLKLIFHSYFTPDVVMKNDIWENSWKIMGIGIVFLTLWKAFRQGKILKDEQDLTV